MEKRITQVKYQLTPAEEKILTAPEIILPVGSNRSDTKPHLSCSQIIMYLRCPKQYEYRYIDQIKEAPAVALVEGTCHHSVNEDNNKHKKKTGKDYTAKRQQTKFADLFSDAKKEIKKWEGEKPDNIIQRGKGLQKDYITNIAPRLFPEFIEDKLDILLGPVRIIGYMDVSGKFINLSRKKVQASIDYKTAKKDKSQDQLESDLQLSLYGWQNAEKRGGLRKNRNAYVGFCNMKKLKTPVCNVQLIPFDVQRIVWFRQVALHVANSISLGAFPVCDSSMNYLCSERFCGYWKRCKGKVFKG